MSDKQSVVSVKEPEIQKVTEYENMIKLIGKGVWKNVNLAKALFVDEDTITAWKKTKRVQDAYTASVMNYVGRRKDVELILNELGLETPAEQPKALVQINYTPIFGGKSVDAIPASTGDPQDIQPQKED